MPALGSPISTPPGMPGVNASHKGKFPGTHFLTLAELTAAITSSATGFSADTWDNGKRVTLAIEPPQVTRVWNGTHLRTFLVGLATQFVLTGDTNVVLSTSGVPGAGTGANGDFALDPATGLVYGPKASGAWPASQFGFAVAASAPAPAPAPASGGTTTALRFSNLSQGGATVAEVGPSPYTYNGADAGEDTNYALGAQVSIPANTDFTYKAKIRQPNGGNQTRIYVTTSATGNPDDGAFISADGHNNQIRTQLGNTVVSELNAGGNVGTDDILRIRRTGSSTATNATYITDVSHDNGSTWVDAHSETGKTAPALFMGASFNGTSGLSAPTSII